MIKITKNATTKVMIHDSYILRWIYQLQD